MVDILIRGVEMPNSCLDCDVLAHCKHRDPAHSYYFSKRPPGCPIIQLPEGHGRLIDGDELQHIIGSFSLAWEYGQGVSDCFAALLSAPTIIKAEGETGES